MVYELTNVTLKYGVREALSISSLKIRKGEKIALLGPNGSGKTSLLKLLDGLIEPSGGCIERRGNLKSVYLHQYPYLLYGSVFYNVGFGCRAMGLDRHETKQRSEDAVAILGLVGMEGRSHRSLSGGEAQRVALARAMATGAEILLLDEPSASADLASISLISDALKRTAENGTTIIFSTHDEEFASSLDPRNVRLKAGKIENEKEGSV